MGKRPQERAMARDPGRSFKVCSLIALAAAGLTPDFLSFFCHIVMQASTFHRRFF